jgi:hypothetical protein
MSYAINALPMSDVCADRIQRQASDCAQTLSRLERMIARSKSAAQRGDVAAERFLAKLTDDIYTVMSELRMDEGEW